MTEYGLNIGRFVADHPDHCIVAGPGGSGYTAQRRDGQGRGAGPKVTALTLDELARLLEQPAS